MRTIIAQLYRRVKGRNFSSSGPIYPGHQRDANNFKLPIQEAIDIGIGLTCGYGLAACICGNIAKAFTEPMEKDWKEKQLWLEEFERYVEERKNL